MPTFTAAELDRLAASTHEAGHAIAAVVLGGRVDTVILDDQHPRTEYVDLAAGTRSAVTFAGPWAETRWTMGRTPTPADMRRSFARNGSDDQSLCAAGGWHQGGHVAPLLERCWPAVKELAKTLYFAGSASHADVCAALGLPEGDNGGPGSLSLAMIRAGSSPGSFTVGTVRHD
ncbi:hypothetical protein BVC93_24390 [Mycobacterium sp. MS1601]|uniref:hypothetical protein n=1 Tax=Mycobacterium sp. MS1601 TaxID=1936029 RepID=UPI00097970C9|nr:hypothetical protein [Mycobacterium sp. MS1601]AQA05022.1 hypothetical protein BVC93_24390 [Mycobacterium sp. MS1601]